ELSLPTIHGVDLPLSLSTIHEIGWSTIRNQRQVQVADVAPWAQWIQIGIRDEQGDLARRGTGSVISQQTSSQGARCSNAPPFSPQHTESVHYQGESGSLASRKSCRLQTLRKAGDRSWSEAESRIGGMFHAGFIVVLAGCPDAHRRLEHPSN